MRSSKFSIAACPTLFTPMQLHHRELLRYAVGAWVGWLRDHAISLQKMISSYDTAFVVAGASVCFADKNLTFIDGDTLNLETTSAVHHKGLLVEGNTTVTSCGREVAAVALRYRPVSIGDHQSAAAKSVNIHPKVQEFFLPDEVVSTTGRQAFKRMSASILDQGELIAEWEHPFKLYRASMDFADQWAFMESAGIVAASREQLAMELMGKDSRLVDALARPLKSWLVDLKRPYFLHDRGVVETKAYWWERRLVFVHSLTTGQAALKVLNAIVIEVMQADEEAKLAMNLCAVIF